MDCFFIFRSFDWCGKKQIATHLAFRPVDDDLHDTLFAADFMSARVTISRMFQDVKSVNDSRSRADVSDTMRLLAAQKFVVGASAPLVGGFDG